jgi:hypothetical protein
MNEKEEERKREGNGGEGCTSSRRLIEGREVEVDG